MKPDAYLKHTVYDVPVDWLIGHDGALHPRVSDYVRQGVVKVIAGPERAHCVIDVMRPYHKPKKQLHIEQEERT